MKNIAAQMINFDREQMRRIANNMPEQYDEKPQVQQVAQIINGVFSQLLATFPASLANRDQNELNEIRRQWVMAFRENGITTMEQVNAGMRVARRQERPFLPSPGQFVAWCKQSGGALGITVDQVISGHHSRTPRSSSTTPRRDMSTHVNQTACVKCWFGCWVIFHVLSSLRVNPPTVSTYGETSVIRQPYH